MTALYAIGDIHGQLAGLTQAIEWIEKDGGPKAPSSFLAIISIGGLTVVAFWIF